MIVPLSSIEREEVQWLWTSRIPIGEITVIEGAPDLGKSTMLLSVAARVTRGLAMPHDDAPPREPANVCILAGEDAASYTIRPRAEAAGADLDRLFVKRERGDGKPLYVTDIPRLRQLIEERELWMLMLDPWTSFLPPGVKLNDESSVRRVLEPLAELAHETRIAIPIVRHWRKAKADSALSQGSGSISIVGVCRAGLIVAPHPDDPGLRVVAAHKHNLCPEPPSMTYRLVSDPHFQVGRVEWGGLADLTADALVAASFVDLDERTKKMSNAKDFLVETLKVGPMLKSEIVALGATMKFTESQLDYASGKLRLRVTRAVARGPVTWELPAVTPHTPHTPHTPYVKTEVGSMAASSLADIERAGAALDLEKDS